MEQLSIFDMLGSDGEQFKAQESTDWKWKFSDYPKSNGLKVFSCFAGGGGSSMGYKLAGFDVIGCLEIDKRMNTLYVKNHNPKYNFNMDIRDFNNIPNSELPQELFDLDILDGSPPCTTFSMCGKRQETWGKMKKFREGQKEQTLDDLAFVFIDTAKKLRPKFVVLENVEGLTKGTAWKYVQNIYKKFESIGYKVKHWLLKGENMGVPQLRHRVFFIATRLDIDLERLNMSFNYKPIVYGQLKSGYGYPLTEWFKKLADNAKFGERNLENACMRVCGKDSFFNYCFVYDHKVAPTLTAHCNNIRWDNKTYLTKEDVLLISTFPQDYQFLNDCPDHIAYVCGMSVPPIMLKRVAERIKPYLELDKGKEQNG